jgi:hypothetical protein
LVTDFLPNLIRVWEAGDITTKMLISVLSPLNAPPLFEYPPFSTYSGADRIRFLDSAFGHQSSTLKPHEQNLLGSLIKTYESDQRAMLLDYGAPCDFDWLFPHQCRRLWSDCLDKRRAVLATAEASQRRLPDEVHRIFLLDELTSIYECEAIGGVRPLLQFWSTFGNVCQVPFDTEIARWTSSPSLSDQFYPASMVMTTGSKQRFVSAMGSDTEHPWIALEIIGVALMLSRFRIVSDVKDAHGRQRAPPEKMICRARFKGKQRVINDEIDFRHGMFEGRFPGEGVPFDRLVFEMAEPAANGSWILRISQIEVWARIMDGQ